MTTQTEVPESEWMRLSHYVKDCSEQVIAFLHFDPGINGYSTTPRSCGLNAVVFGKSLEEAIAACEAFQCSVLPVSVE